MPKGVTSKASVVVAVLAIGAVAGILGTRIAAEPNILRAHADILGPPGYGIEGVIDFTQAPADADFPTPGVTIVARIKGLTPGQHGLHIHEVASCTDTASPFGGAGGHHDPGPFGFSNPDANHPFHMGDLPNLNVNDAGVGRLSFVTSRITLSDGLLSVFDGNGSAVVVKANPDQGITGAAGSGVSGGPRVACGVIEMDF